MLAGRAHVTCTHANDVQRPRPPKPLGAWNQRKLGQKIGKNSLGVADFLSFFPQVPGLRAVRCLGAAPQVWRLGEYPRGKEPPSADSSVSSVAHHLASLGTKLASSFYLKTPSAVEKLGA